MWKGGCGLTTTGTRKTACRPRDLVQAVRQSSVDLRVRLPLRGAGGTAPLRATDDTVGAECDLIYRANSPLSRQVAEYVERRLRAYSDRNVQDRLQALRQ